MPGTRVSVLSMFMEWAKNDPMRIFWLAGLAGTGKTSIAVTLCRMLQDSPDVVLGGAFFCSRTANIAELTDARCILPTLVVSLAELLPGFATALAKELNVDGRAALKPVNLQLTVLLQQPLAALASFVQPIVFVIDALDECGDENEVKKLLLAISALTCDATVKFVLTSRPETHINTSPISNSDHNSILRLHTIDTSEVTEDIRLYINDAFSRDPLDDPWYSESDVSILASRADGLFIFASTVITYILGTGSPNWRRKRLQKVLSAVTSPAAIGPLDAMYEFVLTRASSTSEVDEEELDETKHVLACILTARVPLSIEALAEILDRQATDLRESLRRLVAVVHVPDQHDQPGLRTLHASFGDYLLERATDRLRIVASQGDGALARGCLHIMRKQLYFNVSRSQSSFKRNSRDMVHDISLSVQYACTQWIYHVASLPRPAILNSEIDSTFLPRFLFWLEVMSVLDQVQRATAILITATATVCR